MGQAQSTVSAEAAKSSSLTRSVVPATKKSADHNASRSAMLMKNEFGSGGPQAPERHGSALRGMSGSPYMQADAVRQLQRSYGNSYVGGLIQRKCGCGGSCGPCGDEKKIQRKGTSDLSAVPDHLGAAIQSSGIGNPLAPNARSFMEGRFGRSFDSVRVHADSAAAQAAGALHARAFTLGQDIYFSADEYRPDTPAGKRLLAHELVHTVQQGNSGSREMASRRSVSQPGDALEQQADAVATQVVDSQGALSSIASVGADSAQRQLDLPSLAEIAAGAEQALGTAVEAGEAAVGAVAGAAESVVEAAEEVIDFFATAAGEAALAAAQALADLFGCQVVRRGTCLSITCPEYRLFPSFQKNLGETPPVGFFIPLLEGGAMIGPFPVAGMFGILGYAQGSVEAAIGPGVIRGIQVDLCPLTGNYSATAQLYVAAAIGPRLTLFGGLFAAVGTVIPVVPPIPIIVILQGGLRGTGTAWFIGALQNTVTLAYSGGRLSFSNVTDLMGGVLLTADLDLFAALRLFDKIICQYVYPLAHWEAGRAWRLTIPITAGLGGGGGGTVGVGPITWGPMPIEDIQTAIRPLPTGWNCLSWQEIKKLLCEFGIIPEDWCEEDEPGALKEVTAKGRCKCIGDDKDNCSGLYDVCYRTQKDCRKAQTDLEKICNGPEIARLCNRPKCRVKHSGQQCPKNCEPGEITPVQDDDGPGPAGPCAIPVNFRQTSAGDVGGGTLRFRYEWDSSTTDLDDLRDCRVGEKVDYPNGDPFIWPSPPWNGGGTDNPTILWVPGKDGRAVDNHSTHGFKKPYKRASFTANQIYRYECPCKNGGKPVALSRNISIVRAVTQKSNGDFKYRITKTGAAAEIDPLP